MNNNSKPVISAHFLTRVPSNIRLAQMKYEERADKPECVVNVSIGNVSLPTHPAMQERLFALGAPGSPFAGGVVRYTETSGVEECRGAFKNILSCEGFETDGLYVQVTDGASAAMELLVLGVCGPAGSGESPLMMIDPSYTNYISFAERTGRAIATVPRRLGDDGAFELPAIPKVEEAVLKYKPSALLVIPYDNPTGQLYGREELLGLARLCVKYNLWFISDEAYRELYYVGESIDNELVSIWGITDADVPGIEGRRISIETASKVWNACGLRIGAIVTDNAEFYARSVAENTANLCPNAIGQYIFGALAHETPGQLNEWCGRMRAYYKKHIHAMYNALKKAEPRLIVSNPDASIYIVVDVRNVVKPGFDSLDFVMYCAQKGSVTIEGRQTTLLVSPLQGFYDAPMYDKNPGDTQFRISFVETPENMAKVPELFIKLLRQYEAQR